MRRAGRSMTGDCSSARSWSGFPISGSVWGDMGDAPNSKRRVIPERDTTIGAARMLAFLMTAIDYERKTSRDSILMHSNGTGGRGGSACGCRGSRVPVNAPSCGRDATSTDPKLMITSPGRRPANKKIEIDERGEDLDFIRTKWGAWTPGRDRETWGITCYVCDTVGRY